MWVLLRLFIMLGLLCYRWISRFERQESDEIQQWQGREYGLTFTEDKQQKIISATIELPFSGNFWFQLDAESSADQVLKALGLAREFQTGRSDFDQAIFISCDQPAFLQWLRSDSTTQTLVQRLINTLNATRIYCQGHEIFISFAIPHAPDDARLETAFQLLDQLKPLTAQPEQALDPFFWRVMAVETLIWSVLGYAVGGFIEYRFDLFDPYASPSQALACAIGIGLLMLIGCYGCCRLLIGASSRARLVIWEAALLLALGLPYAAALATKEINELQPTASPTVVTATVHEVFKREHRRRSSRWTSYHATIASSETAFGLYPPRELTISQQQFSRIDSKWRVRLDMQPGLLHLPYVGRYQFYKPSAGASGVSSTSP